MTETRLTRRGEWVSGDWVPVTTGVRRSRTDADPFVADLHAWQRVLPAGARFTGLTAARLRGWWLPPLPRDLPVFVALPEGAHRVRRHGLVALRRSGGEPELLDGIRLDPAADVITACARDLALLDLTCLVDGALFAGDCTLAEVERASRARRRGAPRLREACSLAHPLSESIWETMLRLLHTSCGIRTEPQHVVLDEGGGFVARGDLWLVGTRDLHEYDGGEHLDRVRHRQDLRRERRVGRSGWSRRGYTSQDVLHRAVTVLGDADAAIGRPHDPARVRAWHALLRDSLFTPAGQYRLQLRLGERQVVTRRGGTPSDHPSQ